MKKLLIANKGILEPEALTLLGASTKRGDRSKIGQFGSGNKYALAYLLRAGYNIRIFTGVDARDEIKIELNTRMFREHEFQVLAINGKETSITTEFGYKWTLWQAIRELYSNALDEGLLTFGLFDETEVGYDFNEVTVIEIQATPELEDLMFNIRDYIADGNEVIFEYPAGKIYRKHNAKACVYYRGIRCYETNKESIFDYDFTAYVELGEDRQLRYSWTLPENMWQLLFSCDNKVVIRTLLNEIQNVKYLENEIEASFVTLPSVSTKEEWKECLKGQSIVPRELGGYVADEDKPKTFFLPGRLYNALIGAIGNGLKNKAFTISKGGTLYKTFRPDALQQAVLNEASRFFTECGYPAPIMHPTLTVLFDNKNIYGSISEEDEILISDIVIARGVHQVIQTIIEEHIHITAKVKDCTREFQDASIVEFINYMKNRNAYTI